MITIESINDMKFCILNPEYRGFKVNLYAMVGGNIFHVARDLTLIVANLHHSYFTPTTLTGYINIGIGDPYSYSNVKLAKKLLIYQTYRSILNV